MKINFKNINARESFFIVTGFLLFLIIIIFVSYLIKFLAINIESALNFRSIDAEQDARFNFDGLKELGIGE